MEHTGCAADSARRILGIPHDCFRRFPPFVNVPLRIPDIPRGCVGGYSVRQKSPAEGRFWRHDGFLADAASGLVDAGGEAGSFSDAAANELQQGGERGLHADGAARAGTGD